ncbi:MAG: tRNA lysidine(34) synthetase TilS [Coprococcus sp.]
MDELVRKVYGDIIGGGLLQKGDSVVAGVSGGADSICLLYILMALKPVMHLKLTVVHIHHGLRGEAADADRDFVKKICAAEDVPFVCYQTDIRAMAAARHMSEEEAGRIFRYECFERVRAEKNADKIAVAHHMDDTAETVLMNLFRGSGLKGLAGIPAVRGAVVRPLLYVSRKEIEAFLERNDIAYRTDSTNFETDYTRNRLRLDVLPYIKENINPAAAEHIADTAVLAADVCRYVEEQARKAGESLVHWSAAEKACEIDVEGFIKQDRAIQRELLRQVLGSAAGQMKDIGMVHIESVRQLFDGSAGRRVSLPYGLCAVRNYVSVRITHAYTAENKVENDREAEEIAPDIPGTCLLGDGRKLELSVFSADKNLQIPKKMYTKWFDYDKIKNRLVLRHRRAGDYMIIGGGHKKALRRIMMDDRIPQADRNGLLLLADGSHVLWIPDSGRISDYYRITEATKRILAVQLKEIRNERED